MPLIKILFVISLLVFFEAKRDKKNMFTIEVKGHYTDEILEDFEHIRLRLLYKITPSVYIFKYHGHKHTHQLLEHVRNIFPHLVIEIEPIRVYNNTFKPTFTEPEDRKLISSENLVCSNYYGMGIPKVWKLNITGKGVTIAVNDVGINADLYDLKRNIGNCSLCKNFITNTTNTTPESFEEFLDKPPPHADHGNNVAGIAAAEKDNNFCSAGIAYDARIVVLKVHEVVLNNGYIFLKSFWTSSDVISRSFSHELDEIDIIINAWATSIPFHHLELSTRKSIIHGATKGRSGLGTIYVVAAGPVGNELSHNIDTISVSSIGIGGSQPVNAILDSSVLISGLHQGNNISSSFMVTTSYGDKCVKNFNGVSAAVSQVSGIIALGLQANLRTGFRNQTFEFVYSCSQECISSIEHVEISISFTTTTKNLRAQITSPSATVSTIMDLKVHEYKMPYYNEGNIVTVHIWDEKPQGKWYVTIHNKHYRDKTDVHNISVTIYGTGQSGKDDSRKNTQSTPPYYLFSILPLTLVGIAISIIIRARKDECDTHSYYIPVLKTT